MQHFKERDFTFCSFLLFYRYLLIVFNIRIHRWPSNTMTGNHLSQVFFLVAYWVQILLSDS